MNTYQESRITAIECYHEKTPVTAQAGMGRLQRQEVGTQRDVNRAKSTPGVEQGRVRRWQRRVGGRPPVGHKDTRKPPDVR